MAAADLTFRSHPVDCLKDLLRRWYPQEDFDPDFEQLMREVCDSPAPLDPGRTYTVTCSIVDAEDLL